ncbi:hypothetical protein PspLS_11373 [Pyricularia sp. CBS 133598]|nr:hypothetical protein PspLS_11373 [Pyricularia sp. CBS 133598]
MPTPTTVLFILGYLYGALGVAVPANVNSNLFDAQYANANECPRHNLCRDDHPRGRGRWAQDRCGKKESGADGIEVWPRQPSNCPDVVISWR